MSYGKRKPAKRAQRRKPKTLKRFGMSTKSLVIAPSRTLTQRGTSFFPEKYNVRLPYRENFFITASSVSGLSAIGNTYALNNCFDPRFQFGGKQPLGYDEIAPFYERFWVWKAKVKITFSNPDHDGFYVGYRIRSNLNTVTTVGHNLDYLPQMQHTQIAPLNNTGTQVKVFEFMCPNANIFGISKSQYSNIEYSHANVGDPNLSVLLEPFAYSTEGALSSNLIRCSVDIVYFAQATNKRTFNEST